MGGGSVSSTDWTAYASTHIDTKRSAAEIYTNHGMDASLDPKGITVRESVDSPTNPISTPLIVGLDVTGSMSSVLESMARTGLKQLCASIYDRKPIQYPHIMCMGIGDIEYDHAPLQVTQFEADIRIAEQLLKLWLEQGGGGNSYESYALAWYFAATRTTTDSFKKRGKKGYLFTVGDERPTPKLKASDLRKVFGEGPQEDLTQEQLFDMVSREWEVFHLMVAQGSGYRGDGKEVNKRWTDLLGQRAILLTDHTKMGEVITSTIQVWEGENADKVTASWDGSTAVAVAAAVSGLHNPLATTTSGVVDL